MKIFKNLFLILLLSTFVIACNGENNKKTENQVKTTKELSENLKNRVSINNIIIKKSISYLFFLSILFISFHGINIVLAAPQEVGLYDVFEIEVINTKVYSNPFDYTVIELQATFTSPSGKQIPFFGFYDGDGNGGQTGNVWKLRFMPDEIGTWTYTYIWTDGTPGGSGSFDVVDTGLPGTLQIDSDNSWYLENSRGDIVVILMM